jgi:predicted enzyme related to lactoylglutathione lyase
MAPDSCCLNPTAINSRHQCRRARPATSAGTSFYAGDRESAFAFYSGLVGWTKAEAVESPAGLYQTFATGGAPVGGMMPVIGSLLP